MTISRAQMRRQLYMGGGIASLRPRQEYLLGGIVKSVKKAVKGVGDAVGNIVSSDAGKLALLAAGAYYAPGFGIKASGGFKPFLFGAPTNLTTGAAATSGLLGTGGAFAPSVGKLATTVFGPTGLTGTTGKIAAGIGGASLLAGIFGTEEVAQDLFQSDRTEFNKRVQQYVKNLNPDKQEEALKQIRTDIAALGDVSKAEEIFRRNVAAEGGIMDVPMGEPRQNQQGINELDYRQEGGFVPVGIKEKADDVPAMLSKNEFVMTADAVRGMGNGSIENGAQKMYNLMKSLENRIA